MLPNSARPTAFDCVLVGGGLQNALVALALLERRPEARVALVERGERIGGEHLWCFHARDLGIAERALVEPLVEHRFAGYDVRFPSHERRLTGEYAGFSSARLHARLVERFAAAPSGELLLGASAELVSAHRVRLADGRVLEAELVVDARGPMRGSVPRDCGFQKFVGLELGLERPHALERPILMDARVEQRDGFRFVYVLPLAARRVLVEDTRFSDSPALDEAELRREAIDYARRAGWRVGTIAREERGVLPMPWTAPPAPAPRGPLVAGYAGGYVHPATGYSLACAARLALLVARTPASELFDALATHAREERERARFARLLNRLLFRWYLPEERVPVFERFYRLPEPLVERFYALRSTRADRARILFGRPPRGLSLRARLTSAERSGAIAGR